MNQLTAAFFASFVLALGLFLGNSAEKEMPVHFPPTEVTDVAIVDEDIDLQEFIRRQALSIQEAVPEPDPLVSARSNLLKQMGRRNSGPRLSYS